MKVIVDAAVVVLSGMCHFDLIRYRFVLFIKRIKTLAHVTLYYDNLQCLGFILVILGSETS